MTPLEVFVLDVIRTQLKTISAKSIRKDIEALAKKHGMPSDSQFVYDENLFSLTDGIDDKIMKQIKAIEAIINSANP